MYPLDVTHVVLRRWRAGVRGRIDPRIDTVRGTPACLRPQDCSCPSLSGVLSHAWCQACVELCLLGREGSMLGSLPQGVAHSVCRRRAGCLPGAVASQHAHPPAPLGRSCLFLPWPVPGHHAPTGGPPARPPSCPCCQPVSLFFFFFFFFWCVEESLHAHRCQSYQQSERQIKQTTGECRVGSTSYDKGSCFSIA